MFAAVLSVIFAAVLDKGSLQAIWQIAVDGGRINFNKWLREHEAIKESDKHHHLGYQFAGNKLLSNENQYSSNSILRGHTW
ncbi:hypothetical protein J6590_013664 [Homalodisca vitripennis]|nr:hypothetical protein J6590_013664 [Homalodisca vitripennis]